MIDLLSLKAKHIPNIIYSDIEDEFEGDGNIHEDPLFTDPENGDFTLMEDSPCIDAGEGLDGIDWSTIRPGYGRVNGSTADMGAYGGEGAVDWLE